MKIQVICAESKDGTVEGITQSGATYILELTDQQKLDMKSGMDYGQRFELEGEFINHKFKVHSWSLVR